MVRLNGREPKKPLRADSGLGWALATTATANARVVLDVAEQLGAGGKQVLTVRGGLARDSLFDERFEEIAELFPVFASRLRQHAGTLSGGEQKMLLVARGLMQRPALLLLTQTVSATIMVRARDAIVGLYTGDAAAAALAASLLLYAAAFQFPDGVQVVSAGSLRGLKDTRVPMLLAALAYWGIGMPVGAGLGLGLGWGPRGMWVGLICGLTVAAVLLCTRFWRSARTP